MKLKRWDQNLKGAKFDLMAHEIFREIFREVLLKHCLYLVEVNDPHYPHMIFKYNEGDMSTSYFSGGPDMNK